jgi:aminotransferase
VIFCGGSKLEALSFALLPVLSVRAQLTRESQIREASRYCQLYGAINLAQGLPDFPAPTALKESAQRAIAQDCNQYADTWGLAELRIAIADKMQKYNQIAVDPDRQITVCCGATEGLNIALMSLIDSGDRVLLFEPFYENYLPNLVTVGGVPVFVKLEPPDWRVYREQLQPVFASGIKAVILNTPANPTGKVWSYAELSVIAELCCEYDVYAITDEIYEYIIYAGQHISLMSLPDMAERTITVNGFSKTFCVTGWRLGYTVASPALTSAMRRIHDFITICAPAPLQYAALTAMEFGEAYFQALAEDYRRKRDLLFPILEKIGLQPVLPHGAYYIWTESRAIAPNASLASAILAKDYGVAVVAGNCFSDPQRPPDTVQGLRFCFAKKDSTLIEAVSRLERLL